MFLLSERYRLEFHWEEVDRPGSGLITFKGSYFSGPVLARAQKINDNDHIMLDLCSQTLVLIKKVYTAKLGWGKVQYNKDRTVSLVDARITYNPLLENIPNMKNGDYLVIDTSGHEEADHANNLLYPTYIINQDNDEYDFRG